MALAPNKTKLVCTIGPACETPEMMLRLVQAGMNIARLNFSHGEFAWHASAIRNLRLAAREAGKRLTIMADLPGPKIRVGKLAQEPIQLKPGDGFTLTTAPCVGDVHRVFVNFSNLPSVVKPDACIYLNDGNIELKVVKVSGNDVECGVVVGGELRSQKGVNLPGLKLGISAFTARDHECLKFALENGADALSQSFVETAADVEAVRKAAAALGQAPLIIAKIERAGALNQAEEIVKAADGIMVARGDLAVETPLENIAVVQKRLIRMANLLGKPAITATQMLESMVDHYRPTRAESTDVANAVLDGTDCVMLSEESAVGKYPVEAAGMLARIAAATEPHRAESRGAEISADYDSRSDADLVDFMSRSVRQTAASLAATAVVVPSTTGYAARMVSRFKLPIWIAAVSPTEAVCQGLQFSYGVCAVHSPENPKDWAEFAEGWVRGEGLPVGLVVLAEARSRAHPGVNPRLEIFDLNRVRT